MIRSYKDLLVWQKAIELVVLVYKFTSAFPKEETYGLVSQMRRSAVSIASNIAEGWSRKGTGEFINFLSMAIGSAGELDTQIIISERLTFGEKLLRKESLEMLVEVQKMLPSMIRSLRE